MSAKPPPSENSLKRERAGTYRTPDGRFTVEQSSSGWLVLDAEQTDDLGLPLARGPFATLDDAKGTLAEARSGPAPTSDLTWKASGRSAGRGRCTVVPDARPARSKLAPPTKRATPAKPMRPARPARPAVVIREIRAVDGDALRALWTASGFRLLGDDDLGLARLARRNPGLGLVAAEGTRVVGSALGTWDGRRGWIYHVAVAASHRRRGIATRLVDEVETSMRALGCRKISVMVRPDSDGGTAFWAAMGYDAGASTQFGKELAAD
ncbi:MAG: GNAT family N-acetyltransferase [Candidatus Limnocylindrales bacterium]